MPSPIDPPTLALKVDELVDWLELTALFDAFGVARTDALLGALAELGESAEDNIGERDRQREQLIEQIENEVEVRRTHLGDTYPFELNDTGDELIRNEVWQNQRFSFYLICLITTHVTGSTILRTPPAGELLTRLRNRIFQIVATLSLAGLSSGPAFSVGWPRQTGEVIVELLQRAADAGGGFTVRNPPGQYVSPKEKDGGVDVIAWTPGGQPPPTAFYYGQTASGRNWPDKPVTDHARVFGKAYMEDHMTGNLLYFTLIPYRVLDVSFFNTQSALHMGILERLRLPLRAWEGVQIAANGAPVDDAENIGELSQWLSDYIGFAQVA